MSSLLSILLLALLLTSSTSTLTPNSKTSFQTALKHVDSHGNFTKFELLQRGTKRDAWRRKKKLQERGIHDDQSGIITPVHAAEGDFLMDLSIGTPPLSFSAIVDTGSDLTWTQCQPCQDCFEQPTPIFDPRTSSSYSNVSCSSKFCEALPVSTCSGASCLYLYMYGSGSTEGVMATETFQFGEVSVPQLGFGCGYKNEGNFNGAGLVGLGRGVLSLVSQLHAPEFSYCLTSLDSNKSSILSIGDRGGKNSSIPDQGVVITTPLIKSPLLPSYYFLSLLGISVGETRVPIEESVFRVREDGGGGTFIDSGTTLTYLNPTAFGRVKEEFVRQMGQPSWSIGGVFEVCFNLTAAELPIKVEKMVFHLDGGDWELPPDNFFVYDDNSGVGCLTMGNIGEDNKDISIIGNIQQQNMEVVYDLERETLSLTHTQCDQF
ncbi:hypothetical protein C2S53_019412 [Perilla frutescens var. hirtella]|uniref:nepenthesin n=1 Tax=Perilla frutescens var. hirtella TaxID=608512 RepID=A0AAD4JHA7_PERFH|nr:hypothetical protein C2S53_019412 [Perilla frutescens var. hirtella]